jgi:hypothetical protein
MNKDEAESVDYMIKIYKTKVNELISEVNKLKKENEELRKDKI